MSLTLLTPILILELFICVFCLAYKGYRRGLLRSSVDYAVLIVAAFFGVGISILLASLVDDAFLGLLTSTGALDSAISALGPFTEIILAIATMLSSLIIFLPVTIIVALIGRIIVSIIFKAKTKGADVRADSYVSEDAPFYIKKDKQLGAAVGAAAGFFLAIVIAAPLTGVLKCTGDVIDIAKTFSGSAVELPPEMEDLTEYSDDFMVTGMDALGGGMWFDMATTAYVWGGFTSINDEIDVFKSLGSDGMASLLEDIQRMDDKSLESLNAFIDVTKRSPLLKMVMTVAVTETAEAWSNGGEFMGVARPTIAANPVVDRFVDGVLTVMASSTVKSVDQDLRSLINICRILMEYEPTLSSGDYTEISKMLAEGSLTRRLKAELKANARMRSLEKTIEEIMMQLFADEVNDLSKYALEDRSVLYKKLADILTDVSGMSNSKKVSTIASDVSVAFSDYGVYVSDDVTKSIAEMLVSGIKEEDGIVNEAAVEAYIGGYLSAQP